MPLNSLGLGMVFTARDQASAVMGGISRQLAGIDQQASRTAMGVRGGMALMGAGAVTTAAGVGVLAGALALAAEGGQFEQAVTDLGSISNASAEELVALKNAAIDAGIATQFDPTQAVVGLRTLSQAGFDARTSIDLLNPTLNLAAASLGQLTPEQAGGLVSQSLKAFGIDASNAGEAVDQMAQAVNAFALDFDELPLALGTAARGAQAMRQGLDETLVALGLVKNVIPGTERAATATAVAMERMVDPKVQRAIRGLGAEVVDANTGAFRPFLDIVTDMQPALSRMTDSQRAAWLQATFGREALGGFNAIMQQLTTGVRGANGEMLTGAAAVAELRRQMEEAGGTAARFSDARLNTLTGQLQLLRGSAQTLAIVLGEPIAQVLKPLVSAFLDAFNQVLGFFRSLPDGVKKAVGASVLAFGGLLVALGGFISSAGGIAILVVSLKAIAATLGTVALALAPVLVAFGLLTVGIIGLAFVIKRDVGGIGTLFTQTFEKVKLGFNAIVQLFQQGGFSGAVMEELNKAENAGIKRFAINVFAFAHRITQFFRGIGEGFDTVLAGMGPVVDRFLVALRRLGQSFGFVGDGIDEVAGTPSQRFMAMGARIGTFLGGFVETVVEVVTALADFARGVIDTGKAAIEWFMPVWEAVGESLQALGEEFMNLFTHLGLVNEGAENGQTAWKTVGDVIGGLVVGAFGVLAGILDGIIILVRLVVQGFNWLLEAAFETGKTFALVSARIETFFLNIVDSVRNAVDTLIAEMAKLATHVPASVRPEFLDDLISQGEQAQARVAGRQSAIQARTQALQNVEQMAGGITLSGVEAGERNRQQAINEVAMTRVADRIAQQNRERAPMNITMQVDGEAIGRVSMRGQQQSEAASFTPGEPISWSEG